MTPHPVLIVGSMAFDDLELPTAIARDVIGGSATYASIAAARLAPARVVAVVGDDFPQAELDGLARRGVDVSGIERAQGRTFRWAGRYSGDLSSRTTLDTQLNVFADFRPRIPPAFRDARVVLLGNIHPVLQLEVLDQVAGPAHVVADTMNFWIQGEPDALARLLRRVDMLVINEEEVRELSGIHNVVRAARDVLRRGPRRLIVKRGEYGALLFDEGGIFCVPAYPLESVLDPTGAGDTFAGGLAGYLAGQPELHGAAVRRGMLVGTALASFCVEAIGAARLGAVTEAELTARVAALRALGDAHGPGSAG